MVQHAVRWQSVPEQLNFGLSTVKMGDDLFDSSTNSVPPGDGDGVSRGSYSQQGRAIPRPPRVSVTLSDYLAADFGQSPDDPGDFGWFTPSVSGGSIEDLLPSSDIRDTYPAPSPTYPRTPLLFKAWDSTQKTASLSPESVADDLASYPREAPSPEGPADSNGKQQTSFTSFCRPPGGSAASNAAANSGTIASGIPQDQQQKHEEQQRFMPRGESTLPCNSSSSTSNDVNERAYITAATSGATASTSGNKRGSLPAYRPSQKKMADINQWHALHPYASSTGPLAASSEGGGACIMHLKRPTFPISTRHFPEKAPTPTAAWNRGGRERGWRGGETQHNDRANLKGSPVLFGTRGTTAPGACEAGLRDGRHDSRTSPSSSQDDARGSGGTGGRANSSMGPRLRKSKAKRFAWALTEIRVVAGSAPWCPPRAEYLVVAVLGRGKLVAGWRRASDFERLAIVARQSWMTKVRGKSQECSFTLSIARVDAPVSAIIFFVFYV